AYARPVTVCPRRLRPRGTRTRNHPRMKQIAVVAAFVAALNCLGRGGPLGVGPALAAAAGQNDPDDVKIRGLLQRLEQIARRADTAGVLRLSRRRASTHR